MAWVNIGIVLVALAVAVTAQKTCFSSAESYRMPWLPPSLVIEEPLASILPPNCCTQYDQGDVFDAQKECHLCYNKTRSTPGFAADPNNCQRFVMCEPNGKGGWNTFNMTCPKCTFWNQELLTCVQVTYNCTQTHVTDKFVNYTTPVENPLMFCIDFEDNDLVSDAYGEYRPYVFNDNVVIVTDPNCPQGRRCGYFNASVLEVPFFSNNYNSPYLRIGLTYKILQVANMDQGIISNNCFDGTPNAAGNSLYCSANNNFFMAGLKAPSPGPPDADVSQPTSIGLWVDVMMVWDGFNLHVEVDGNPSSTVPFPGPIQNSHCPLTIGAFSNNRLNTFFQGYMDNYA